MTTVTKSAMLKYTTFARKIHEYLDYFITKKHTTYTEHLIINDVPCAPVRLVKVSYITVFPKLTLCKNKSEFYKTLYCILLKFYHNIYYKYPTKWIELKYMIDTYFSHHVWHFSYTIKPEYGRKILYNDCKVMLFH